MEIYIEDFLIENIIINFCILKLVYLTTKPQTSFCKMLLASILGSLFSILISIHLNKILLLNIFKLTCACVMIFIAFKQTKKQYIFSLILLFIYTYALGGILTSFNTNAYYTNSAIISVNKLNLHTVCALIIVLSYMFELIAKQLKWKINKSNLIYSITLYKNNKSVKINAYLDTGNFINHDGKPVLILDLNSYLKLTKTNLIDYYLSNTETIKTTTVTGINNLKLFTLDKIIIKNNKKNIEIKNQLVAINNTCFKNTNYQALISPLFL